MDEKRANKRLEIGIELSISDLYKEDTNTIMDIESPIEVTDISADGIGFISECILPIGYYFIANIELAKELPQIITDVRILRSSAIDKTKYQYGCEFVSVSPRVKKMLEDFEKTLKN
ncbi:MAG TPA: PilZ domain-containing protein [Lachnospiraceae bacterium]|nr:PilZ domain-containing protein [Lachnospiraceae bacterium]